MRWPRTVASRYPRIADARALAVRLDPDATFRNAFLDRYLFDAGDRRASQGR